MYKLELYSRKTCGFCHMAKRVLNSRGIDFQEIDITNDAALAAEMQQRSNRRTVPQIFLNDEHIGGFEELLAAIRTDAFKKLLQQTA